MNLSTKSILRLAAAPITIQALTLFHLPTTLALSNNSMTSPQGSSRSHSSSSNDQCTATSALEKARALVMPSREATLRRDASVYNFWDQNDQLLEEAWKEWQTTEEHKALPPLDESLIHPKLRKAVNDIWDSVENDDYDQVAAQEGVLKELFDEVAPGVYSVYFWDLDKLPILKQWMEAAVDSKIPIRPPYGIVLNRKGFMLDPRSVGYWAAPDFQEFYKNVLVDKYIRPISRLFFPDSIRQQDDSESFAFSIQYQVGGDESIRHHTDASTITFNLNLDETKLWTGSSLYFWDSERRYQVDWAPGTAMMHLGRTMHAALPIESGIRNNIVVWTMGKDGGRGYGGPLTTSDGKYHEDYQLTREERWTKPKEPTEKPWDRWTPF